MLYYFLEAWVSKKPFAGRMEKKEKNVKLRKKKSNHKLYCAKNFWVFAGDKLRHSIRAKGAL